jgi:hypothetical protein
MLLSFSVRSIMRMMNKMKKINTVFVAAVMCALMAGSLFSAELPRPEYKNSVIFAMTYSLTSSSAETEVAYMKTQFGNGLYAPLACSLFLGADMDWHIDISDAANNIQSFKKNVDKLVKKAKEYGVGLHITLTYGISRNPQYYNPAKDEDIRNAQWYNDNNIMSENQWNKSQIQQSQQPQSGELSFDLNMIDHHNSNIASEEGISTAESSVSSYALTTMSRYARKLRNHLEAKVKAAFDYLQQVQQDNPGFLLVISAPGEAELNLHPVNSYVYLQEFFCDFSPFAVLEFRDWITHGGMYTSGGKYDGEGYVNGGSRYRGSSGLQNFNKDFGTSFTTWNLKYYNWSLSDAVDGDYTDTYNPDTNRIPADDYTFDGMMPTGGNRYIAGGFDPPRVMKQKGEDVYWDLWNLFRESLVAHYVRDMAAVARDSGFPRDHYYTHQIPGDYLFGTRPGDPAIPYLNPRYYSSASPLWTADAFDDIGMGITMYDIDFGTWYARTSQYILPVIDSMSSNWGVMEYNPEIIPQGFGVEMAPAQSIYEQIMRLYEYNVHYVGFFEWKDSLEHQFKGTNREEAARLFFDAIKDKARKSTDTVFTPKRVEGAAGTYNASAGTVTLNWSDKIWSDLGHTWEDWGDFKEFVIYRGYTENFQCDSSSEIARVTGYTYTDKNFVLSGAAYYKIAAVNVKSKPGNTVTVGVGTGGTGTPVLNVSRDRMDFGATTAGTAGGEQAFFVSNTGSGVLNWTVGKDADWLTVSPTSGVQGGMVGVTVNTAGKTAGTYTAEITVTDPNAKNVSQSIQVQLTVYRNGGDSVPFGSFETPIHNTVVQSSVPFTGWVLDDIGVAGVKIYRKEGNGMVYIGDAMLVEGARPDVEALYSNYPNNSSAGWGYMMLTNFLPDGGNGTFTFYAEATDVTGHRVTLGSKTVTVDNANAVKPFGAIDFPLPGGTVSGDAYRNHGWVLTPLPNCIPTDGSTIDVYVDGVNLGHPKYNIARSDISSLFPGYCNSEGAHAYFDIDTTALTDGVHTIAWNAEDTAGNSDGIGSRYFTVRNAAGTGRSSVGTTAGTGDGREIRVPDAGTIEYIRGFCSNAEPRKALPGKNGNISIDIHELERVEIRIPGFQSGYLNLNGQLRPFPAGSFADAARGIFYWLPGPGFRGQFRFIFFFADKNGKSVKKNVTINIRPGR